ncbi:MAG: voltage-dependent potassium channel subunit beta [Candidatus Latescibacteria bacterium]|nr:voltage-dependent potassium channel subunit beta [Candidatus Latescibacterota bacterium]NIM22185.1 voltage-dependent potassium channel subunit beta [Candidatus Latescibacterota bacterium]NIM64735.1 voltage-dependent potassium channel subunit beta [Candidatus Latescibacterota bacterium]NIO01245.1 voltage-dependent potassium channel subunit beta [Candidatus Latescibacterota bacterium]NIO27630.1 voltage-dependent potassium channel subunit beta [Candidatus Latescibacterota bacterium]
MEYRFLGSSGLKVSALSLGSWVTYGSQVGEDVAFECMTAAYEHGVNFFDNAEAYASGESEVVMGNVIRRAGWKRSDLVISTKIFWGGQGPNDRGLSRKHIIEGVNASLARIKLDYVDLIFCHRPDPDTPIEETVRAMNWVIDQGKAFYWGTSEWSADEIMEAAMIAKREHLVGPQMEQPQYNMFHRDRVEREYARLYDDIGLGLTVWSPLGSGLLTGKYDDGCPPQTRASLAGMEWLREELVGETAAENREKVRQLKSIAEEVGCTRAQLALAWCLANPNVSTVITGASRLEQVKENMAALDVVAKLTPDVIGSIEELLDNKPPAAPNYR